MHSADNLLAFLAVIALLGVVAISVTGFSARPSWPSTQNSPPSARRLFPPSDRGDEQHDDPAKMLAHCSDDTTPARRESIGTPAIQTRPRDLSNRATSDRSRRRQHGFDSDDDVRARRRAFDRHRPDPTQ